MTNIQHESGAESDEDCEIFFLKPVNEYNIIDKIKEANKELFSNETKLDSELIFETQHNRKVSFATNLEEYEPQNGINFQELEVELGIYFKENNEINLEKIDVETHLEIIAEEEIAPENEASETCETPSQANIQVEDQHLTIQEIKNENAENLKEPAEKQSLEFSANCLNVDENVILEEICEEILLMDMESDKIEKTSVTKVPNAGPWQRKMLKQITFDYKEDDDELDNKSLTNLLILDNENDSNEEENICEEYNYNEFVNNDSGTEEKIIENHKENEEDDKWSIIVASYLSDETGNEKTSLTSANTRNAPPSAKTRKLPLNKRFSLHQKTKSVNAIGTCPNHLVSNNHCFMPPPEVSDLKLHYKTCCEFKSVQQNLPEYRGYISEYGLSKEQLIKRELQLQQRQQVKVVELLKTSEVQMRKMHDNEKAFTTWLKNKMRFPINKTRNMFDVRRPFGLRKYTNSGGNTSNDDTKQFFDSNKQRSISAKLKKRNCKT